MLFSTPITEINLIHKKIARLRRNTWCFVKVCSFPNRSCDIFFTIFTTSRIYSFKKFARLRRTIWQSGQGIWLLVPPPTRKSVATPLIMLIGYISWTKKIRWAVAGPTISVRAGAAWYEWIRARWVPIRKRWALNWRMSEYLKVDVNKTFVWDRYIRDRMIHAQNK